METKLRQAEFFCEKLSTIDYLEMECYLSAFMAAWKSVVYYAIAALPREQRRGDPKLNQWAKKRLGGEQLEAFQTLTRLRDHDIHIEPVLPQASPRTFAAWTFRAHSFAGLRRLVLVDESRGTTHTPKTLCENGLVAIRLLVLDVKAVP